MKKILLFFIAVLSLCMVSCGSGEQKASENADSVAQQVTESATLDGKWMSADNKTVGIDIDINECVVKGINNPNFAYEGWEWGANEAGDSIIFTSADGKIVACAVKFDAKNLTLTTPEGEEQKYVR